jgi:hypothetical protein
MLDALKRVRDRFFGDGDASVAIPVFDGTLKPNNVLESADVFLDLPGLEDLVAGADGELYAACEQDVLHVDAMGGTRLVVHFPSPVQALARFGQGLVAATQDGLSFVGGALDGKRVDAMDGRSLACVNALCEGPGGVLLISDGSKRTTYQDWSRDLLDHGHSGRVLSYEPGTGASRVLVDGLAYCYGVCADESRVLASESWAHQVIALEGNRRDVVVGGLPGYPSRICRASGGGFWLTVFAARTQLLEFVLREDEFRAEMMRTVEPRYWIAPALSSGADFLEPLQQGGVRQMGILKPWAPPRSYGLVVRLGPDLHPRYSLHSRVGGRHHGITAAVEHDGALFVLSKGAGRLLKIALSDIDQRDGSHDTDS